jgi:chorismate mutase
MRRSFNVAHWLSFIFEEAQRRHPREEGLLDVLGQVYPFISTPASKSQLYDYPIIDAIAARVNKVKQAVVFKADRAEGLAPHRQKENIAKAIALAEQRLPGDTEFAAQVERVYQALVPASVAVQQTMFDRTYLIDDWDGLGFRGLDQAV